MDGVNQISQPWKAISTEYLEQQAKLARETNLLTKTQEPAGRVVYKGGSGGAPGNAVSWKFVLYDTQDDHSTPSGDEKN